MTGFGAEDAPELIVSGRRRLVSGVGMAAEHEQGFAHSPVASAQPEVERGAPYTCAGDLDRAAPW